MCNHSQVQSFDGQDYCIQCNEELDTTTGISLKEQEIQDNDIDFMMDDTSSEDDRDERDSERDYESAYFDSMSER